MTLTLDDVRNKRFRIARKSGYEVLEVDEFVDEVEESFAQLAEENQTLKKQLEVVRHAAPASAPTAHPATPAEESAPARGHGMPTAIVVTTGKDASAAVVRLVELSTQQAEQLVAEASEDATRIREEAERNAHQVTTDARTRAERVESEARVHAERVESEATARAEQMDRELAARRAELFGDLDRERERLAGAVEELRRFEATYRTNLTGQLREQIELLELTRAEPTDVPELARAEHAGAHAQDPHAQNPDAQKPHAQNHGAASATPRLDALLGDQH